MDIEWLRNALKQPGKTQRALAKHMGVDESAITRILKGDRKIQLHEADLIRSYFDNPNSLVQLNSFKRTKVERKPGYGLKITKIAAPGVWREEGALLMLDRTFVPSSPDPRFSGMAQFAVLIEGTKKYAICVDYDDDHSLQDGDLIVAERHRDGLVETTIRRVSKTRDGWQASLEVKSYPPSDVIHSIDDLRVVGKVLGYYEPAN